MKASELICELSDLVNKHGDKEVYINGYEVSVVDYNIAYDCIDIDG